MSAEASAIFYFVAFVLFVIVAILELVPRRLPLGFIALGLACWVFVNFWNALAAS